MRRRFESSAIAGNEATAMVRLRENVMSRSAAAEQAGCVGNSERTEWAVIA